MVTIYGMFMGYCALSYGDIMVFAVTKNYRSSNIRVMYKVWRWGVGWMFLQCTSHSKLMIDPWSAFKYKYPLQFPYSVRLIDV